MKQINKIENPDAKFDLYFLAYDSPKSLAHGEHWTARQGVLELTHNYGTEKDENFKVANGNSEPGKGFGHICISVDAIQAACQRIEDAGYKFQKKLTDGRMRHIAFALDPDGYWVAWYPLKMIAMKLIILLGGNNFFQPRGEYCKCERDRRGIVPV